MTTAADSTARPAILGFNHVNVSVSDMDASIRFYRDGLGLPLLGRGRVQYAHLDVIVGQPGSDIEWAELQLPSGLVELFRYHSPRGAPIDNTVTNPGTAHICFETDDVTALSRHLHALGYASESDQPVLIPGGDWDGWLSIYFKDPDHFTVELVQRP